MAHAQHPETSNPAYVVLDAFAALSAEITPAELLAEFLRLCLAATGAERGAVLLEEGEGERREIFARALGVAGQPIVLQRMPPGESAGLPHTLIETVRATGARLRFDEAVGADSAQATLAVPILRDLKLIGVVTLTGRSFAAEAVRVVEVLSSQFAGALEKSELVERLTREVKERQRAEAALRFIAEASTALAESLDYEAALDQVLRLAVPFLADWCTVDLLEPDGTMRRVAAGHRDPAAQALLVQIRGTQSEWGSPRTSLEVLAAGRPLLFGEVTDDVLEKYVRDPEVRALVRRLGVSSGMAVPLVVQGRAIGAMTFSSSTPDRRFGPGDLALAEELARRAAVAIDNARLYREAQEAIKLRDEFLSIASHELNTPITSLQLLVDGFFSAGDVATSPDNLARLVQLIGRQVGRLGKLVREVLDVQRIQAGFFELELDSVDLVAVVDAGARRAREDLARAGCTLELRGPERVVGRWDRARLDQLFAVLLGNAIKFARGTPIVVTLEAPADGDRVRLVVADQGIGIPPERLPHIFGRFERAVSSKHYGGLGLGLYIAHQIVHALGGRISAESTPGAGARFIVDLPRLAGG
jgi:signal transduction histidine kinase